MSSKLLWTLSETVKTHHEGKIVAIAHSVRSHRIAREAFKTPRNLSHPDTVCPSYYVRYGTHVAYSCDVRLWTREGAYRPCASVELEIFGFRKRHIQRPVHSFVTISVDGDQQLETPHSSDTLTPKWTFDKPLQIMVRASSSIKFSVYREHVVLSNVGNNNHFCGEVQMDLQDVLVNPYTIHRLECPIYSRETNLEFRVIIELEPTFQHDSLLLHAEERLQRNDSSRELKRKSSAMSLIGLAVDNLDQIVGIVDGLVEIHPMCKVAWMVLGSVYKAFKDQHALNHQADNLASELKETLAYAKECRDLKAIPEATDVLLEIAKLVVQSAAAFDAHIKYSITARAFMSVATKAPEKRIAECEERMKALRKKLHEVLTIRIWQGQNELLAHHKNNSSTQSLLRTYSTNWPDRSTLYVPLKGLHKPGYSPLYLSSPPSDEPYEPLRRPSPPPAPFILRDDDCRRFTSSPEPMPLDLPLSMPTPPFAFMSSSLPKPYSPMPSMWSPWPIASRTPSFATDSGRTLSSKSSCSSLAEPCDCPPHTEPNIYNPDNVNEGSTEGISSGRSTPAGWKSMINPPSESCGSPRNPLSDLPNKSQPCTALNAPPLAMPVPMTWSQCSLR